jgi:hypothetical protein
LILVLDVMIFGEVEERMKDRNIINGLNGGQEV